MQFTACVAIVFYTFFVSRSNQYADCSAAGHEAHGRSSVVAIVNFSEVEEAASDVAEKIYGEGGMRTAIERAVLEGADPKLTALYHRGQVVFHFKQVVRLVAEERNIDLVINGPDPVSSTKDGESYTIPTLSAGYPLFTSTQIDLTEQIVARFRPRFERALRAASEPRFAPADK